MTHMRTGLPAHERTALIRARERLGLNRRQLSERVGISRSYIFRIEAGLYDPTIRIITAWLNALDPGASIQLFAPHPHLQEWRKLVVKEITHQISVAA